MSFGVGLADVFETLHFAKVTYDSWKEAPERYRAIESRLRNLRSTLQRLVTQYQNTKRHGSRSSQRDLRVTLESIEATLDDLAQILECRSSLNFWDRLRLNSHQINDLSAALDRHIQDLVCLCSALGLENDHHLRRGQERLESGQRALKRGQEELSNLMGQLTYFEAPVFPIKVGLKSAHPLWTMPSLVANYSQCEGTSDRAWEEFTRTEGLLSNRLPPYQSPIFRYSRAATPPARQIPQARTEALTPPVLEMYNSTKSTISSSSMQRLLNPPRRPQGISHSYHHPCDTLVDLGRPNNDGSFGERRHRDRDRRRSFRSEIQLESHSRSEVVFVHRSVVEPS